MAAHSQKNDKLNTNHDNLIANYPLARYNSWRVGGKANQAYYPKNQQDLQAFLLELPPKEPLFWIGLGSNLLISDLGFSGTVIMTRKGLANVSWLSGDKLRVEAGTTCAKLAKYYIGQGNNSGVFLASIPGTVGGALTMNAGAYGRDTWSLVTAVETIDRKGILRIRPASDFQIAYRYVSGIKEEWFLAGHFYIPKLGSRQDAKSLCQAILAHRSKTQPVGTFNCGSVFQNPPGCYAGKMIESCGLKGYRIGGASISKKHANFIINDKAATARDIELLIIEAASVVAKKHKVLLVPEVRLIR